ncbi:MAG: hypothetical protein JNK19_08560 [Tabrizicola sp.]|nr:hypothetical protein [Tabrizicola sp.]
MGRHFRVKLVVGEAVLLESESVDRLLADLVNEADFWTSVFPEGARSPHSDTIIAPRYSELIAAIRVYAFKEDGLDLRGRADLAIYPARASVEGKALAYYAKTDLAFALLRYLWAVSGWLNESQTAETYDKVAEGVGELLVTAVRLGSSFR